MPGPIPGLGGGVQLESVAHIIQVALTPVFLLSGVGGLLNVFNTRLARVADHSEHAAELLVDAEDEDDIAALRVHLARLRHRTLALDASIAFGAIGGVAACGAAFALFVGALSDTGGATALFFLFGIALACTVCALAAFLVDSVLAWYGLRTEGPLPRPKPLVAKA